MRMKKMSAFILSAAGMLALILDGRTALQGASEGLALCMQAVIPSLFPFLFLSANLTSALWGSSPAIIRPLTKALGIPEGAEPVLIAGFLGGYPTGAQTIAQAYREGCLDHGTACHLLRFCSNAGPAFLFGIIAGQFSDLRTVWVLWAVHVLSAMIVGILDTCENPGRSQLPGRAISVTEALTGAVRTTGIICGWVVLFRILLEFLDSWVLWILPQTYKPLIWGLLELSNGCCALSSVTPEGLRFILCAAMLSFGGVCVAMQTGSVASGLPMTAYLRGKLLQTFFSLGLSVCYVRGYGIILPVLPGLFLLRGILKKRGSIREVSRV